MLLTCINIIYTLKYLYKNTYFIQEILKKNIQLISNYIIFVHITEIIIIYFRFNKNTRLKYVNDFWSEIFLFIFVIIFIIQFNTIRFYYCIKWYFDEFFI